MADFSDMPPKKRLRSQCTEEKTVASPEKTKPTKECSTTIVLKVKVPACKYRIPIEMNANDTVLMLKNKVLEQEKMYPVPVERVVLQTHTTHVELLDSLRFLKDYAVYYYPDNDIDVYLKPPPPRNVAAVGDECRKLMVTILPMNSKAKIEIKVNAEDRVAVLREKLEEGHKKVRFRLPTRGRYFFIHKMNPMVERMSFRWHNVQHGDTISTSDGDITRRTKRPQELSTTQKLVG